MSNDPSTNRVPQSGDIQIVFANITKDGAALGYDLTDASGFWFSMAYDDPGKASPDFSINSIDHADSFSIDNGSSSVTVAVSGANVTGVGNYYVALWMNVSGNFTSHDQKYFTTFEQVAPS